MNRIKQSVFKADKSSIKTTSAQELAFNQSWLSMLGMAVTVGLLLSLLFVLLVLVMQPVQANERESGQNEPVASDVQHSSSIHYRHLDDVGQGSLLLKMGQGYTALPTLKTQVKMAVKGISVKAWVTQSFTNNTAKWQEAIYVFPLPEKSAVDKFTLKVGEQVIEGLIKEKQQARVMYEKAKTSGKKAALVEQSRPNLFNTRVANIPPGETIAMTIEYHQVLDYQTSEKGGSFSLRFPLVVAPRYIPKQLVTSTLAESSQSGFVMQDAVSSITAPYSVDSKINPVSIEIKLNAGFPLQQITSPSHAINIEGTLAKAGEQPISITLREGDVPADRDFILRWQPVVGHSPRAALFVEPSSKPDEKDIFYSLVMLQPPEQLFQSSVLAKETIFIIDTSGSMHGSSIKQAKQALQWAIDNLNPQDRFNIYQFNNRYEKLFAEPVPLDKGHTQQAKQYIDKLSADGGTEMAGVLEAALTAPVDKAYVRQVIFLTDGSVGNESALFNLIHQNLGNTRLFTVGIGSAPNSFFMRKAAQMGRGHFTYIGQLNEVEDKMTRLFKQLRSPVLTDLNIEWPSEVGSVETYPQRLPDLYQGQPLVIKSRLKVNQPITSPVIVRGRGGDTQWHTSVTLPKMVAKQANNSDAQGVSDSSLSLSSGLGKLWAREKISQLMDRLHQGAAKDEIRAAVLPVALEHHLVSAFTSLVAIDKTPARVKQALHSQKLPLNMPQGWTMHKLLSMPKTATAKPFYLMAGSSLVVIAIVMLLMMSGYLTWQRKRHIFLSMAVEKEKARVKA